MSESPELFLPGRLAAIPENADLFGTFAGDVEQGPVNRGITVRPPVHEPHWSFGGVFSPMFSMPDSLTKTTPESGRSDYFGAPWSMAVQSDGSFRCTFSSDSSRLE